MRELVGMIVTRVLKKVGDKKDEWAQHWIIRTFEGRFRFIIIAPFLF
jgi:hypothetical protein